MILLGVLVNFTFGETAKDVIVVDLVRDTVEDDFILILSCSVIWDGILASLYDSFCNSLRLSHVADIEENPSIPEQFLL